MGSFYPETPLPGKSGERIGIYGLVLAARNACDHQGIATFHRLNKFLVLFALCPRKIIQRKAGFLAINLELDLALLAVAIAGLNRYYISVRLAWAMRNIHTCFASICPVIIAIQLCGYARHETDAASLGFFAINRPFIEYLQFPCGRKSRMCAGK